MPPEKGWKGMLTVVPWDWACLESPDMPAHWLAARHFSSLPARSWQQRQHAARQPVRKAHGELTLFVHIAMPQPFLSAFYPGSIPVAFSW